MLPETHLPHGTCRGRPCRPGWASGRSGCRSHMADGSWRVPLVHTCIPPGPRAPPASPSYTCAPAVLRGPCSLFLWTFAHIWRTPGYSPRPLRCTHSLHASFRHLGFWETSLRARSWVPRGSCAHRRNGCASPVTASSARGVHGVLSCWPLTPCATWGSRKCSPRSRVEVDCPERACGFRVTGTRQGPQQRDTEPFLCARCPLGSCSRTRELGSDPVASGA